MPNVSKLTQAEKDAIIQKSPLTMPTNPTKSGWNDTKIKEKLADFVVDEQDSVLAALDKIVDNVNATLDISVGNVIILPTLPVDLTPYEDMYILISDVNNNIIASYYIDNGLALEARFGSTNNIVVSEQQPLGQLPGDLWYDIQEDDEILLGGTFAQVSFIGTISGGLFTQTITDIISGGEF